MGRLERILIRDGKYQTIAVYNTLLLRGERVQWFIKPLYFPVICFFSYSSTAILVSKVENVNL